MTWHARILAQCIRALRASSPLRERRTAGRFVRFGSFEADLQEGKLTKSGAGFACKSSRFGFLRCCWSIPVNSSPGKKSVKNCGRTIRLWSLTHALNTAVRKLREALNDSADNPRFLETVPRRGYRFVAPVALPPEPHAVASIRAPSPLDTCIFGSPLRFDHGNRSRWRILVSSPSWPPNRSRRHHRSRRFCQQHGRGGV